MSRGSIIAGKAVILLSIQDKVDATLAKVRTKLRRFSNTLGSVGGSSIRGGFLGGLLSSAITRDYMLFEKQILKLQGKLGLFDRSAEQTRKTMSDLERTILKLGKTTSFTAQEVAEAATELAQAGFAAKEIKNTLEPLLDLARGTDRPLAPTAEFLTNTIRTFNLETSQAVEVADKFVKATRLGTIELTDLQESMKYAGGSAFNLKQDLSTLLGFLVQASETGLRGSLGGTSFNTMMTNLAKYQERFTAFTGQPLKKKPNGELDLVKTMVDLSIAMRGMSGVDKVAKLGEIFNLRAQRFASATQEMERVVYFIDQIDKSAKEAAQSRELLESGLWGSWIRASSAVETFSKTLGRLQSTFLGKILDTVPLLVDMLDRLAISNQNVVIGILAAPFAIAAMGVAFIGLQKILLGVAGALGLVRGALGAVGNIVGPGIGQQLSFLSSIAKMKSSGGLGMIGGGLKGLAVGGYNRVSNFREAMKKYALHRSIARGRQRLANQVRVIPPGRSANIVQLLGLPGSTSGMAGSTTMDGSTSPIPGLGQRRQARIPFFAKEAEKALDKRGRKLGDLIVKQKMRISLLRKESATEKTLSGALSEVNQRIQRQEKAYDRLYALKKARGELGTGPGSFKKKQWVDNQIRRLIPVVSVDYQKLQKKLMADLSAARAGRTAKLRGANARLASLVKAGKVPDPITGLITTPGKKYSPNWTRRQSMGGPLAVFRQNWSQGWKKKADTELININRQQRKFSLRKSATKAAGMSGAAKTEMAAFNALTKMGGGKHLLSIGKGLGALTQGFMKFTAATARFAFSKAGITTVLQILLIFGDRIPGIRDAFESLGKGFGVFFNEIKKIGSLGAGPFQRIMEGITMYKEGNTQGGINAFLEGIQGLVGVISGQLRAAWWGFAEQVGWVYDIFKKIVGSVWEIAKLITGISGTLIGGYLRDIGDMYGPLFGGAGSSSDTAKGIVKSIGMFVGELGKFLLSMKSFMYEWLHDFQVGLATIFSTPGAKVAFGIQHLKRMSDLKNDKKLIEDQVEAFKAAIDRAFTSSTEGFGAAKEAAQQDALRASQMSELEQMIQGKSPTSSGSASVKNLNEAAKEIKDALKIAANFIGSVSQAQGNMLKAFAPKRDLEKEQLMEQQETNEHLSTIIRKGGKFVFTS